MIGKIGHKVGKHLVPKVPARSGYIRQQPYMVENGSITTSATGTYTWTTTLAQPGDLLFYNVGAGNGGHDIVDIYEDWNLIAGVGITTGLTYYKLITQYDIESNQIYEFTRQTGGTGGGSGLWVLIRNANPKTPYTIAGDVTFSGTSVTCPSSQVTVPNLSWVWAVRGGGQNYNPTSFNNSFIKIADGPSTRNAHAYRVYSEETLLQDVIMTWSLARIGRALFIIING